MTLRKVENTELNKEEFVPFNMSMLYYLRLNKIMEEKDKCAIQGDYIGWYRCLASIFRNVEFRIENAKNIKEKLDKAKEYIFNQLPREARGLASRKAEEFLSESESDLLKFMDNKGMIFPKIETTVGLDALNKRYGLTK